MLGILLGLASCANAQHSAKSHARTAQYRVLHPFNAGTWNSSPVAIKVLVLPANMSGAAKREKMAIMEAAIAISLVHPNIVQVRAVPRAPQHRAGACCASCTPTSCRCVLCLVASPG